MTEPTSRDTKKEKAQQSEPRNKKRQEKAKGTGPKSTGRKAAHKERKAHKAAMLEAAKKKPKQEKAPV